MYKKSNYVHKTSRAPYARQRRATPRPRGGGQYINPERFIKSANPGESADYTPTNDFSNFAMHPILKSNVTSKGYRTPSEIQDKAIPIGLDGHDIVGVADTGTGKTAAFSLPVLNALLRRPGSQALIVAPTRELAIQIEEQCSILSKNSGIRSAALIGGMPISRQINALRGGARLIIGTPGRIKDHLGQGTLNLSNCDMVVLDEVDRMLDMGFLPDVRQILDLLPSNHQAFFFSATLSPEIKRLIDTFCHDPKVVNVKGGETSSNVNQDVIRYSDKEERLESLQNLLNRETTAKALVFSKTKYGAERLAKELAARGFKVEALHGGKTQGARKRALDAFRNNRINVLVATDVAARGIDVKDITHVINFDVPQTYEDYVHRIGRAGRAGRPGQAVTFVER